MGIRIDTTGTDYTAPARRLLGILDDSSYYSLGVVFGADLCVLGGTRHPSCWEPLKTAWHQLDERERERVSQSRLQSMLARGLIAALPSGPDSSVRYVPGDDLRILLAARESPAFTIATHHEPRTPDVTYFQPSGTSAIVQEIPERAGRHWPRPPRSPLDVIFSYRFSSQAFAARELARWALKPVPAARSRPKPPRLICFSGRTEAGRHASYQLAVHRNGKKAHVDAPGISADFTHRELAGFLTDTVTSWAGTRRSLAARPASAVSSEPGPEGP
jgi:hypothetical protein